MVQGQDEGEGQQPGAVRPGAERGWRPEHELPPPRRAPARLQRPALPGCHAPRASERPLSGARLGRRAQGTYDKLLAEVPKYKMITTSILSDRLRVRGIRLPSGPRCPGLPARPQLRGPHDAPRGPVAARRAGAARRSPMLEPKQGPPLTIRRRRRPHPPADRWLSRSRRYPGAALQGPDQARGGPPRPGHLHPCHRCLSTGRALATM
jgi:hypothetical protein